MGLCKSRLASQSQRVQDAASPERELQTYESEPEEPVDVFVTTLSGQELCIRCLLSTSGLALKEQIEKLKGHRPKHQRLILGTVLLQNRASLESQGVRAGDSLHLVVGCWLLPEVPSPDHEWDFTADADDSRQSAFRDAFGNLEAVGHNVTRDEHGLHFEDRRSHVSLGEWSWGGTTTFEVVLRYSRATLNAPFFFSTDARGHVMLYSGGTTEGNDLKVWITPDGTAVHNSYMCGVFVRDAQGFFENHEWAHVVITMQGTTCSAYKDGQLICTKRGMRCAPPEGLRQRNELGGGGAFAGHGCGSHFQGDIAYFRIWHGQALAASQVASLYRNHADTTFNVQM
eukprot:gb/GFBE01058155.1/.p1 GENE.gb/GFBE01058155.1/~~gb/GFBE01058155.1/.p1  ORF type:complete len:342 (+),score=53.55 gb/GFBE01058155.1/:1-1026(+)